MAPARPRIGVHKGTFHCDEAPACALQKLPEYPEAEILRTRHPTLLGGEYDPQRHLYNHQLRSFTESMSFLRPGKAWQMKLSSVGLIYLPLGQSLLAQLLDTSMDDRIVDSLYDKIYEYFVEEVDAVDYGISQWEGGRPQYALTSTLSSWLAQLNPTWNQPNQDIEAGCYCVMELVREEFLQRLDFYKHSWLPSWARVEEILAIDSRCSQVEKL